jgi:hypothetical protein
MGRTITCQERHQPRFKVVNPQAFLSGLVAYGENRNLVTLMEKINMDLISETETIKKISIYVILGI